MSKIVPVARPLPTATLAAAHALSHALLSSPHPTVSGLSRWMLGDDYVALRTLSDELGLYVSILSVSEGREDLRVRATDRARRLARRYRLDSECGGVEAGGMDDTVLRNPDGYGAAQREDQALAA